MSPEGTSEFLHHVPCSACGSRDAAALYTDGHTHCFSCGAYGASDGEPKQSTKKARMADFIEGEFQPLLKRGLTVETCRLWGYRSGQDKGQSAQIADYHDEAGAVVAQKVRYPDKTFRVVGSLKTALLFGQRMWRDAGKKVVITEGEIDAMTVSQIQDHKWPVVSIPNGAQGAAKALAKHLEWLLGFEEIILMFDDDEAGRDAVAECAPLFPPGRCKVATIKGFKDASDALQGKQKGAIIEAIWGAKTYHPDGIVSGADVWERVKKRKPAASSPMVLPYNTLQSMTRGVRLEELVLLLAGSGIGKSTILRAFVVEALHQGETVGGLFLEEPVERTALGFLGAHMGKALHLDEREYEELPEAERAEREAAWEAMGGNTRLHLYDHFGSTGEDGLMDKLRYLVQGLGCTRLFLDHISIVVSGSDEGDERKLIDRMMTKLRTFTNEVKCSLFVVCHLTRPKEGKGHEEGAQVRSGQARGSHALVQLSDTVLGFERDQQDEKTKNITTIRLLKCRWTGKTGIAGHLVFDDETHTLDEITMQQFEAVKGGAAAHGFSNATDDGEF